MSLRSSPEALPVELDGIDLECLALRGLWWPQAQTLFVADVHLGKAESFRALGVPVPAGPQGPTAATLDRLGRLLQSRPVQRLVILGDLLHARAAQSQAVMTPLTQWREGHRSLQIQLLRGNHDTKAGDPPAHLGIEMLDEPSALGRFRLQHEPRHAWAMEASNGGTRELHRDAQRRGRAAAACGESLTSCNDPRPGIALSGHLHPVISLSGRAGDRARLPCFCIAEDEIVLPAFGAFTGGAPVQRLPGTRCVAIAQDRLFSIP
ncbi:MAG: metallophosphoesterase [Burkholderiaceae bacterium]